MRIDEVLLLELNVHPDALKAIDDYLAYLEKTFMNKYAPGMNHKPFLKRLKNDIVNGKPLWKGTKQGLPFATDDEYGEDYWDILIQYTPTEKDPDFIKNAPGEVYHLKRSTNKYNQNFNKDFTWQTPLEQLISRLFSPTTQAKRDMHVIHDGDVWDDDMAEYVPGASFPDLVKLSKLKDAPDHVKKVLPSIIQKYEQGKYDYQSLNDAIVKFKITVANKWKYDADEKTRVEKEAPIIMTFADGFMWVRLDSQQEMEREGEMMQNCIGGTYCPVDPESADSDDLDDRDDDPYADIDPELDWDEKQQALIYSLRDKDGESHISVHYDEWTWEGKPIDFIPEPAEIKGKQNEEVSKKYLPYFKKFEAFLEKNPEKFGPPLKKDAQVQKRPKRDNSPEARMKNEVENYLNQLDRMIKDVSYNNDDERVDTGYPQGYVDDIEEFLDVKVRLDTEQRLFPDADPDDPDTLPEEGTEMRRYFDALQTMANFYDSKVLRPIAKRYGLNPNPLFAKKIKDVDGQDMSQMVKAAKMARAIAFPEDAGQNESVELTRLKQLAGL